MTRRQMAVPVRTMMSLKTEEVVQVLLLVRVTIFFQEVNAKLQKQQTSTTELCHLYK